MNRIARHPEHTTDRPPSPRIPAKRRDSSRLTHHLILPAGIIAAMCLSTLAFAQDQTLSDNAPSDTPASTPDPTQPDDMMQRLLAPEPVRDRTVRTRMPSVTLMGRVLRSGQPGMAALRIGDRTILAREGAVLTVPGQDQAPVEVDVVRVDRDAVVLRSRVNNVQIALN